MAAVLRVKRRHDAEPLNALLIACKRTKTSENEETEDPTTNDPLTTVFKFAGTVNNQEKTAVENLIRTLSKDELKATFKQRPVDILQKVREKTKQASAESRYKVINCFRSLDSDVLKDNENKVMTVIDVEDSISCANEKQQAIEKDDKYVYDLYYGQTEDQVFTDDKVSIHPFDQELVFDNYRDNYPEAECESDDSNSESNWRNDYPDSDHSERSIDDDDMREAVSNMMLEDGSDLSTEDDFVYAVNEADVEIHGYKYAKYKAKVKEELDEDDSNSSNSSGQSEFSKPSEYFVLTRMKHGKLDYTSDDTSDSDRD
ncbi:female sterile (2) ltoPP43 [Lasioglossum baleicum]|uniref:female sterile (2) ltoPP43 n=1 Tax=Lasioglossum baleicum TaxID=434251 RepID=UPI003FCD7188